MITLCGTLDLDCIVEGIESEEQLAQLQSLGCTLVQGYLIARPMTIDDLGAWIAARTQTFDDTQRISA